MKEGVVRFGAFSLDRDAGLLRRDRDPVALRKKCWQVLLYLAEHPGVLLSNEELLDAAWPGIAVTPKTLTNLIGELRLALADDPVQPRYIETVHGRGYRFVAPIEPEPREGSSGVRARATEPFDAARGSTLDPFIGRAGELARLRDCFDRALAGKPEVALVAGEPGIGKTTLLRAFLSGVQALEPSPLSDCVHCIEQHGMREAYMPLLLAVGGWASASEPWFLDLLRRYAPTWLLQIPWLIGDDERRELERSLAGSGSGRMLREGLGFLAALSERRPVVLLVEDLHWADPATLDFLTAVRKRTGDARLLIAGTYRPVEALLREEPLPSVAAKLRDLASTLLTLEPFTRSDVRAFLEHRFADGEVADKVVDAVEERSGGNPLFVRAICDHLVTAGLVRQGRSGWELAQDPSAVDIGLPDNLRDVIEAQLAMIDGSEREVLEVASVAGGEFDVEVVAAGLAAAPETVEEALHRLARRGQFIRHGQSFATSPRSHEFLHAMYQTVLYEGVALRRRRRLHQRIGEQLEVMQARSGYTPAELASHFLRSGDHRRAVRYLEAAAEVAARRSATSEMVSLLDHALVELEQLPAGHERDEAELRLLVARQLGRIHSGEADTASLGATYERVRALSTRVEDLFTRFVALRALWLHWILASDYGAVDEAAQRTLELAESARDPALAAQAHLMLGGAGCFRGEPEQARLHLERGLELHGIAGERRPFALSLGFDVGVELRCYLGWALWLLGFPDRALRCVEEALAMAPGDPNSRALATTYLIGQHHLRGEWSLAHSRAEDLAAVGEEFALDLWKRAGMLLAGWALAEQGQLDAAMPLMQGSGVGEGSVGVDIPRAAFLGRIALACGRMGNPAQGLTIVDDALARIARTAGRASEAELHRIKGELLVQLAVAEGTIGRDSQDASAAANWEGADECFERAIELARLQLARSWELRAATSRYRLWQRRGGARGRAARRALEDVYRSFTEGFGTADLEEARRLLEEPTPASPALGKTGVEAGRKARR